MLFYFKRFSKRVTTSRFWITLARDYYKEVSKNPVAQQEVVSIVLERCTEAVLNIRSSEVKREKSKAYYPLERVCHFCVCIYDQLL